MSKQWNDNLRKRMEDVEFTPPEGLFDDVMKAMPAITPSETKKRPIVLWGQRIAAAAMVAIALVAGYSLLQTEPEHIEQMAQQITTPTEAENISSAEEEIFVEKGILAEATTLGTTAAVASTPKAKKSVQSQAAANKQAAEPMQAEATTEPKTEATEQSPSAKESANAPSPNTLARPKNEPPQTIRRTPKQANPMRRNLLAYATSKQSDKGGLSASLHASGLSAGKSMYGSQQVFIVNSTLYGGRAEVGTDTPTDAIIHSEERSLSTKRRHLQPIRVGVSLRYNLSERWAVESGVTYTKLHSENMIGNRDNYYDEQTSLHYIGLPLNAVYEIWSSRRVALYLSAGGMIEKCVSGSTRTRYILDGEVFDSNRQSEMVQPLQWSVNAAAGMEVSLWQGIALYAEPGVGYRFDNGADLETIYRERPFDFNLSLGLRFTLR